MLSPPQRLHGSHGGVIGVGRKWKKRRRQPLLDTIPNIAFHQCSTPGGGWPVTLNK